MNMPEGRRMDHLTVAREPESMLGRFVVVNPPPLPTLWHRWGCFWLVSWFHWRLYRRLLRERTFEVVDCTSTTLTLE